MNSPHLLILENSVRLGLFVRVTHRILIKAGHRMSHKGGNLLYDRRTVQISAVTLADTPFKLAFITLVVYANSPSNVSGTEEKNTVEPVYNDIGLCHTSSIASGIL
jgi:hypothetical protein